VSAPLPESRLERSLVTKAQIEAFASDGIVKVPQAIDRRWIDPLLALTERQLARPSRWVTDSNRGATKGRIFTDRYLWREHPLIKSFEMVAPSGVRSHGHTSRCVDWAGRIPRRRPFSGSLVCENRCGDSAGRRPD
jgi:hypothetical protein